MICFNTEQGLEYGVNILLNCSTELVRQVVVEESTHCDREHANGEKARRDAQRDAYGHVGLLEFCRVVSRFVSTSQPTTFHTPKRH